MVSAQNGAYPRLEAKFELSGVTGNPFDYTENDVRVTLTDPKKASVELFAFYDGGKTWRVRYTPMQAGDYTLTRITRNGTEVKPDSLDKRTFRVAGKPGAGFVRHDPKNLYRFRFDNGGVYYPLGHNVPWRGGDNIEVATHFERMGAVGENWSRVWMCHWDGKNLDWVPNKTLPPGTYDLDVARKWDSIVEAAEKNGIHFQLVLQHHGQYSSTVNPNWSDNPWNKQRGGFLASPEDFFTDDHARALTRIKYRYILARWGYSPSVLSWELFNEVQFTDAIRNHHPEKVTAWHREMADFLRKNDMAQHLVTTSSETSIGGLYDGMDYIQPHAYPPDAMSAILALQPTVWKRPIFFGEIGAANENHSDDASFVHNILWTSLMSESSGAAQFWYWDQVERLKLYGQYQAVTRYLKASDLPALDGLKTIRPEIETAQAGSVSFGPGTGWGKSEQTEFTVPSSGIVEGIGKMSGYLQGQANRALFPNATFQTDYRQAGEFVVVMRQASRNGAHPVIFLDGRRVAERDFPAQAGDQNINVTLSVPVPAGKHTIRLENTGADWVVISRITLTPYGASLRALGKANRNHAFAWVYGGDTKKTAGIAGKVTIPNLTPGRYRVQWWNTTTGEVLTTRTVTVAADKRLTVETPSVTSDVALTAAPAS